MEQKKNQKDVLIVRDEKTGANQKDFLLFDKNSNPLDSFLDNFFR